MCGIVGSVGLGSSYVAKALLFLYHRGPDDEGIFTDGHVCLGHRRLSIQDVSGGHQPMTINGYTIIFNGEIYNHAELRGKYLKDESFLTDSDTETLLKLFISNGKACFELIDGMFALVIYDSKSNKLFFARDRAGKKPLYVYQDQKKVFFASELNAIKETLGALAINEEAICSYLRCGFFYKTLTPYRKVRELEAGIVEELDVQTLDIKRYQYFDIGNYYKKKTDLDTEGSLKKLDELLHKNIKDRLLSSDLEVGAFLSGGIDSSLVVAIASQYQKNLKTFTVKFDGAYDESYLAKLTATKYKTEHYELAISMDLRNDIEKILLNYGEPFADSSAIPSYYVSKEAKKYVTVVLNGDGADELFGGYRRYVPSANAILGIALRFSFLFKILPKPHDKKSFYSHIHRLLVMSRKKDLDFYLSSTGDIFEDEYDFLQNKIFDSMDKFIKNINLDPLSKMMYLDFNILLFSDLLVKMDIATMSQSLEGRSPFLSKDILEFAPTLNNKDKIRRTSTKYILRELSKKYLPYGLIYQPKRGFEVPLKKWIENDLKENIFDTLSNNNYSSHFIDKEFISDLLSYKLNISKEKRAKMLWVMYCLEVWKKNQ